MYVAPIKLPKDALLPVDDIVTYSIVDVSVGLAPPAAIPLVEEEQAAINPLAPDQVSNEMESPPVAFVR